ncbi:WD40 repeat domain-containing protein [Serratia quinivorans]|jgi:WD40 repeat protein|uniref:WD40 repeat domain-containing protein n=1 Tax=Serratia quinivorans TaxID=137545 RepID=UPI00217793ED|nr:WD40 repeat domain-containing protein [Serratia quinivorans]CAI1093940.1 Uncharacterized protein containing caspase domain [Serratia quinivorans]
MSKDNINAFAYDREMNTIFAGTKGGEILIIPADSFAVSTQKKIHWGTIESIAISPERKLLACLSGDRRVSILRYDEHHHIDIIAIFSVRDMGLDDFGIFHSTSQAIALHPTKQQIATRSGNSSVVELDFTGTPISQVRVCDEDIATLCYSQSGHYLLAGSTGGTIGLIANGKLQNSIKPEGLTETVHWFEFLENDRYVVACDSRRVLELLVVADRQLTYRCGDIFAHDDMEHVTLSHDKKICLASSFDRRVYRINLDTLESQGIVMTAAFKLRWIKFLKDSDRIIIAQNRDGSLVKYDILSGETIGMIKNTPDAIWSAYRDQNALICAGERGYLYKIPVNSGEILLGPPSKRALTDEHSGYIKRIVPMESNDFIAVMSRGRIIVHQNGHSTTHDLDTAFRDVCYCPQRQQCYLASEDGTVYQYHQGQLIALHQGEEPIWSLGVSPDGNMLAFAERLGQIHLYDLNQRQVVETTACRLPKRLKWFDNQTLYISYSGAIHKIFFDDQWQHHVEFIGPNDNTVEDFIFIDDYIAFITYNRRIWLYDRISATKLDSVYNSEDYMKSIIHIKDNRFATLGRSGYLQQYELHNEQIKPGPQLKMV